ncbi:MAG: MarR family transcriptional regulator [Gemmatimonadaceae bacterium]
MPSLKQVIRQQRPFVSVAEEAYLNLVRTAEILGEGLVETLRPHGLTATQYNALRILRGAGDAGLQCSEVGERMVTREPDVTRLLDRLEKAGLVERERDSTDRRVVTARITAGGLARLRKLDRPVARLHEVQLGRVGERALRGLIHTLELLGGRARGER